MHIGSKGVKCELAYLVTLSVHDLIVLEELPPDVKEVRLDLKCTQWKRWNTRATFIMMKVPVVTLNGVGFSVLFVLFPEGCASVPIIITILYP